MGDNALLASNELRASMDDIEMSGLTAAPAPKKRPSWAKLAGALMGLVAAAAVLAVVLGKRQQAVSPGERQAGGPQKVVTVESYYAGLDLTLEGPALKAALTALIGPHTKVSYNGLWTAFYSTDEDSSACPASTLVDVYSSACWEEGEQQCGNYKAEGDCYNREHSWPKSWWGGFEQGQGAESDLFHLYPTDGYVNGLRANLPLGEVSSPRYTSSNGAKVGPCVSAGSSGDCFEPPAAFKGDFARSYFYVSTAYANAGWTCCDEAGVDGAAIKPWMEAVLRAWANSDPPSAKEHSRNDAVFVLQNNRNPYIDYPALVDQIQDF